MEQVYRTLQETQVPKQKAPEMQIKATTGFDLELAQTRFEITLEKKLTEIVQLKAELQQCKNDL